MVASGKVDHDAMSEHINTSLKLVTRIILGCAALALSASVLSWLVMTAPQAEINLDAGPARSVIVLSAIQTDVRRRFDGYGVAEAVDHADVPARVTSTVAELPRLTRPGAAVTVGQLLVKLDDHDFREEQIIAEQSIADIEAQLALLSVDQEAAEQRRDISREEVELAQKDVERIQEMQRQDAAPQREVDLARQQFLARQTSLVSAKQSVSQLKSRRSQLIANQRSQEASRRLAQQRVERCRIVSPHAGYIEAVDVTEGESLTAGMRVVRVIDPTLIEVPLRLPSSARPGLQVGDVVQLHATGASSATWEGRLVRLSPEDDPQTRTLAAYVEYTQSHRSGADTEYLAPGQFVRGEVRGAVSREHWIVPRRSIKDDRILLVKSGVIFSRPVDVDYAISGDFPQFGLPDRDWLVLRSPLAEGELVVLDPTRSLIDGLPVAPIEAADAMAALDRSIHGEESTQ